MDWHNSHICDDENSHIRGDIDTTHVCKVKAMETDIHDEDKLTYEMRKEAKFKPKTSH